ncbi:hypothetical protein [Sphingobium nicotianae]|uniref:Uncharacterized protein n=1 Tax=Sphingobium nicotianae TaxID=2782607 RepID=A0A9X1DB50_9SPHN|nr:hypothetical protein [Sphingobium nicotianae]MBT2186805.1 hypothetical protein [Sphingobium nicotianae]
MVKIDPTHLGEGSSLRETIEEIRASYPLSAMVERYAPVRPNAPAFGAWLGA